MKKRSLTVVKGKERCKGEEGKVSGEGDGVNVDDSYEKGRMKMKEE